MTVYKNIMSNAYYLHIACQQEDRLKSSIFTLEYFSSAKRHP